MPFAAKSVATQKNGTVKKGFRLITDKNGRERYMTDDTKKKDVKPVVKKVKKEVAETKEVKNKGVAQQNKKVVEGKPKKKKQDVVKDEEKLKVDFD